jgi:hypothetical protein
MEYTPIELKERFWCYATFMHVRETLWFGFLLGFLFGVIGIWILAVASLFMMLGPLETVSQLLFAPGRWLSEQMMSDSSVGTSGTLLLFGFNGVLYGVIGMLLQAVGRRVRRG